MLLIDPPDRYAPLKDWQDFLKQLLSLPQEDRGVQAARAEAERILAKPPPRGE